MDEDAQKVATEKLAGMKINIGDIANTHRPEIRNNILPGAQNYVGNIRIGRIQFHYSFVCFTLIWKCTLVGFDSIGMTARLDTVGNSLWSELVAGLRERKDIFTGEARDNAFYNIRVNQVQMLCKGNKYRPVEESRSNFLNLKKLKIF